MRAEESCDTCGAASHNLRANRAEGRADEAEALLARILKRATPHPDDTDEDRKRDLYHIEGLARAFRAFLPKDKP